MRRETLAHCHLRSLDMMRSQEGIRGTGRQHDPGAGSVDDLLLCSVLSAHPADVANVVRQGSYDEMQPVLRQYRPPQPEAPKNILGDEGDHRGMLGVVIWRITTREPLNDEAASFVQQGSDLGVLPAKRAQEHI